MLRVGSIFPVAQVLERFFGRDEIDVITPTRPDDRERLGQARIAGCPQPIGFLGVEVAATQHARDLAQDDGQASKRLRSEEAAQGTLVRWLTLKRSPKALGLLADDGDDGPAAGGIGQGVVDQVELWLPIDLGGSARYIHGNARLHQFEQRGPGVRRLPVRNYFTGNSPPCRLVGAASAASTAACLTVAPRMREATPE